MNKTCYLPILDTLGANKLWFAPFTRCSKLKYNRFGIPEPQVPKRHWVRAQSLNLVLTPLVAFDMQGNRLGMGGGFYDRTLAFLNRRQYWFKPQVIGIGYDFQKTTGLIRQSWDVPLDGVVTPDNLYLR